MLITSILYPFSIPPLCLSCAVSLVDEVLTMPEQTVDATGAGTLNEIHDSGIFPRLDALSAVHPFLARKWFFPSFALIQGTVEC